MSTIPTLPDRTDVAIVGGGIMGTATAYFLTEATDADVTLLEKGNIASGSTGDSSAILRHHYGEQEIYSKMAWWSHQFFRSFESELGQQIAHEESPLVRFGVEGTEEAEYAEAGHEVLERLDVPTSRYTAEELSDRFPMYEGLDRYDFAISDDAAGYSDGADAANGFARAAAERGATIVTDTAVEGIEIDDGAVAGVRSSDGTTSCERVVVAAGPWTTELAADVGVDIPITPTREQVVILEPPAEYAEKYPSLTPTTSMPGGRLYLRPDFGEGILVATHYLTEECDPDAYDNKPEEATLLELTDLVARNIPELADARVQGQYCGVYSTTPDHDFVLDQAGPDGCYFACGFSGHGFKHGPAVGKIMSDLVTEGDTDLVDVDFFSLDRFAGDETGHGKPVDNI